jgi:hypothetical protein
MSNVTLIVIRIVITSKAVISIVILSKYAISKVIISKVAISKVIISIVVVSFLQLPFKLCYSEGGGQFNKYFMAVTYCLMKLSQLTKLHTT